MLGLIDQLRMAPHWRISPLLPQTKVTYIVSIVVFYLISNLSLQLTNWLFIRAQYNNHHMLSIIMFQGYVKTSSTQKLHNKSPK